MGFAIPRDVVNNVEIGIFLLRELQTLMQFLDAVARCSRKSRQVLNLFATLSGQRSERATPRSRVI